MDDLLNIALSNAVVAAVLALVAAAAGAVCRRPALVHGLWLLVLLKLVTPPLLRIPVVWPTATTASQVDVAPVVADEPVAESDSSALEQSAIVLVLPTTEEDEPAASTDTATAPPAPAPSDPPLWPRVLPFVWLAGSLGWFVLALARLERFRRLLRFAHGAPASLQKRAERLSRRLGLPRCPQIGLLPGRLAPMLWAAGGSPRLLLPADLLDLLGDEQLDTLLVHELAHLRRRDHWVRALEFVAMGLYWWHPVVWYARRELRENEEQCCDAWVVSTLPGAGRTYATALMDTLDFLSTARPAVPPLASGIGHVHDLKRRLTMIMRGTTPRALSWPGCLAVLAVGAFFLPMLPALQARAPVKEGAEITIQLHEENAQKQHQAKTELDKLEADLKQKMAEVAKAKARLDAVKKTQAHAAEKMKIEEFGKLNKAIIVLDQTARAEGGKKSAAARIEIVVNAEGLNVKELAKKLESVLPKNSRIRIESSTTALDLGKQKGILQYQGEFKILPNKKGELVGPHNMLFKVLPSTAAPADKPAAPPGTPQDKRINDLEKKLEKVLHELQEMRKQMKEPRSGLPPTGDAVSGIKVRFLELPAPPPSPPEAPKRP